MSLTIQGPAVEAQTIGRGPITFSAAGTTQGRTNSCQQFAWIERFRQVVIGAEFESDDAVGGVAACGEHDHREVGMGAQLATKFESVVTRQHQVKDDQVNGLASEQAPHRFSVTGGMRSEPLPHQVIAQ